MQFASLERRIARLEALSAVRRERRLRVFGETGEDPRALIIRRLEDLARRNKAAAAAEAAQGSGRQWSAHPGLPCAEPGPETAGAAGEGPAAEHSELPEPLPQGVEPGLPGAGSAGPPPGRPSRQQTAGAPPRPPPQPLARPFARPCEAPGARSCGIACRLGRGVDCRVLARRGLALAPAPSSDPPPAFGSGRTAA